MQAGRLPRDKLADAYKLDQALLNAESRPVAELKNHIETMNLPVDKLRLKVLLSAFNAGAGQILMHDLQRRGFLDFVTRHQASPVTLRVGQCVNLLPRDDEEASKVAAQALCKKAGQDVGGNVWKTQAVRAMKASFVKRGMVPSMDSPIPEGAPSWVQDFDEMARIEEVKLSIEQMMSACLKDYKEDWTYEEASIICFCGGECADYDRVLIEAVRGGRAQEYGALLHKLCRVLASKRPFEKVCDFPVFVDCDLRAQVLLERGIITDVKQVAETTATSDTQAPSVSEKTVYSVRLPCGSTDGFSTESEVREGITGSRLELCVNLDKVKATQARDWLQALVERVGPDPGGQVWKQEWLRAIRDKWLLDGFLDKTGGAEAVQARFEAKLQEEKWAYFRSFEAWCADDASGASKLIQALAKDCAEIQVPEGCSGGETLVVPQSMARKGKKFLATLPAPCKPGDTVTVEEEDGWTVEEAGVVAFCNNWADVLARSVRDSRPDYAGLLHKSYRALANRAKDQPPAVDTYRPLRDRLHSKGLVDFEPEWADVVARGRSFFMEQSKLQQQSIERAKEEADAKGETEIELTLKSSGGSTRARFTSAGATACMKGTCRDIVPRGFTFMNWGKGQREVVDSPIVKFVSKPRDDIGLHTAIDTDGGQNFVFPPMTLFTVVGGRGPGWELDTTDSLLQIYRNEFDGLVPPTVKDSQGRLCLTRSCIKQWLDRAEFVNTEAQKIWWEEKSDEEKEAWKAGCLTAEYLPEGTNCSIYGVNQPLVIVEATYVLPLASTSSSGGGGGGGDAAVGTGTTTLIAATTDEDMWNVLFGYGLWDAKLCASAMALTYHNREAYIRGVDELIFLPPLTMEEEWLRDDKWADWSGREFSGAEEWRYVTSGAAVEEDTPVGKHEHGHAGWTLGRFMAHINDTIRAATDGRAQPLTRDEVIACRLYTGPAYQQLNNHFLRQVGGVEDRQWRLRLAQAPSFSYASTITHLLSAVCKLSFVNSLSIGTGSCGEGGGGEGAVAGAGNKELLLYRGVSGKLADACFVPDAQGMITCVDTGFMSTSSGRETPIHYIRGGIGVLFVLHCSATGGEAASVADAHHTGAVLQAVSQYPLEVETLFPPLTMLNVMKDDEGQFMIEDVTAQASGDGGGTVLLKEIHVVPSFV